MKYLNDASNRLKLFLNILILVISLYGVTKKNYTYQGPPFFQQLMIDSFAPAQQGVFHIKESISYFFNHYLFIVNASVENVSLRKKVSDLEEQLFQLAELDRENKRLKKLLKFGNEIKREKVLAQVIGWDASNEFKVLRINKGSSDGVKIKSTVVTSGGLVGHVYRVSWNYSDILTILDQNARIDGIVDRTRSHGIIQGFSESKCIMKYVTRTEPVSIGDQIITAGLGEIYPKSLRIGTISNIERESYGITQVIEVTPSVDFKKLEEVVILIASEEIPAFNPEELQEENEANNENK